MEQIAHDEWMAVDQDEENLARQASSEYARILEQQRVTAREVPMNGMRADHSSVDLHGGTDLGSGEKTNSGKDSNSAKKPEGTSENARSEPKTGEKEVISLEGDDDDEAILGDDAVGADDAFAAGAAESPAAASGENSEHPIDGGNTGAPTGTPSLSFTDFMRKQLGRKK